MDVIKFDDKFNRVTKMLKGIQYIVDDQGRKKKCCS